MSSDIRACQGKLAEILRDSGKDVDEAARLYKELLDYKTKCWGSLDPTVIVTAAHHARCLDLKGSTVEALKTYQKAYPICLKQWGEKDLDVQKIRSWIEAAKKTDDRKDSIQG